MGRKCTKPTSSISLSLNTSSEVMEEESQVGFDELNLQEVVASGSLDFDSWTSLISDVEKTHQDDIEKISLVYDSFLSEYPLCYGYWRKYANHKAHLCNVDKAIKVFEQAVQSATYSVGVWVDYCSFSMSVFEDPFDVRRLFNRGLSFVGKDYLCHSLWDKYIEFELSQQHWSSLAHIYIQTLKFPTKKLHHYYNSFKKLTAIWEEEMEGQSNSTAKVQPKTVLDCEVTTRCKDDEILSVIKDLLDPSDGLLRSKALQKYVSIGERLYQGACLLDDKIHGFETHIRRPYFHIKPLDAPQMENWHHYLDFVEMHGDFDWAVKLYERCLIACANFPEFWMRYVEFMERKGGREIANFALDRATKVFLKSVPAIHHFNARYKEQIGDTFGARVAFLKCDADSDSIFVENIVKQANMEKRLGNFVAAANIYDKALEMAAKKQKLHTLPVIYVKFSRLKYMITGSADAARDVLIDGIKQIPCSKLLLEELINFIILHGGSTDMNVVGSIIFDAISQGPDESQGFSSRDGEDISNLYLELVDFCGTIHDVRKAWILHRKLFPHSLRSTSSSTRPASYTKSLKKTIEERQEIPASMHPYLLGSNTSGHLSQLPVTEQEISLPENHHIQSDQAVTDQLQLRKADDNASERLQHESPIVLEWSQDAPEPNNSAVGVLEKVANDTESIRDFRENSEANDMQEDHDHRFEQDLKPISLENLSLNTQNTDTPDSIPTTAHECEAPQETCMSTESTIESGHDIDVNPSISSTLGARSADSAQMLNGGLLESGQCTNGSPSISSQAGTQAADSSQMIDGSMLKVVLKTNKIPSVSSPLGTPAVDSATNLVKPVGPSSSPSNEKSILCQTLPEPQMSANSGECGLQINNLDNPDSDSDICRQSQDKKDQQWQVSPQPQYQKTEMGTRGNACQSMPQESLGDQQGVQARYQYDAAITEGNLSASHAWPLQTVQQPGFMSPSQSQLPAQPVAYPQGQMSQYPMQSNDHSGNIQSSQAYYQMWQYYYYQQQQQQQFLQQQQYYHQQQQLQEQLPQQQYQQQQLQMQQQYLQQQEQQPPYQQHNQFEQQHQQQQLQLQQQQQYHQQQLQSQQQQFSQQQLQQQPPYQAQQIQQQQLQNQQYSQSQQKPQYHQLPPPQLLQQLLQQQQWKQQQQQENHQEQQQQEQEHKQHQQPASQIQVQVLTPPQGVDGLRIGFGTEMVKKNLLESLYAETYMDSLVRAGVMDANIPVPFSPGKNLDPCGACAMSLEDESP